LVDPSDPRLQPEPEIIVEEPVEEVVLEVSAEIFDTIWVVTDLNGMTPDGAHQSTLSITTDRRAGGIGGCNNYFAEAYFDGPALSFGDIVSTRMHCGDEAMDQESAFFAALTSVRSYELDGDLYLLDIDGNTVLRLSQVDVN
jgi:putative lipoprotein